MPRHNAAPKFRRYRCTICDRVVPWVWIAHRLAILRVDPDGRVSVRCAEHEPVPVASVAPAPRRVAFE
jgi:hypothetical protein